MAPDMRLLFLVAGWLTAALSGHPSPSPSDQRDSSSTERSPLEPGERLGVRLVNGSSRCSGTVEVRLRSSWEPACGALWSRTAAEALCSLLDCGGAQGPEPPFLPTPELPPGPAAGNASGTPNATRAVAPAVLCSSAKWQLCTVVEHPCSSDGRPAQVTCTENRDLRLVGGGSSCAGRVEMLEHGQWGSVCDDTWDLEDAHVVCRQLSCGWAVEALPGLHFAPGQGPIHRDQVNCSGSEDYLWDCLGLPGNGYCGHKEDAGVVCSEHQSWRLTGGADACEGQVEVYFRGVWNTVCDSTWYSPEAKVLCQDLGCGTVAQVPKGLPHSLAGKMYYSCEGWEPTLANCSWRYNNSNLCSQSQAARVLCSGARSLLNLSTPEVPASFQPVTVDSQRYRFTDEEVQQNRFQMPPLEEGFEEMHTSQVSPANPEHCIAEAPSLGPQHHPRNSSHSSTSSGEEYCNSPSSRLPPWDSRVFPSERNPLLEQPPNLELAGSQATFSAGPQPDDSSSTSSGEWYQNFQPPPQPPTEQFGCPGSHNPQSDCSSSEDYDDIGAA
ncbi:T-cell differentiation antigen CD6 isoform X2 [Vicugna pacos]|uniref:T-cell differentiation antigen CD6 isoform X2 n=1 Tax=Vicugna pacos TaxID=30538 RepID=A0ABM5E1B8_VICPA